jgi:hypothetical protein
MKMIKENEWDVDDKRANVKTKKKTDREITTRK